jgi:ribosomal RNA-processing protein 9
MRWPILKPCLVIRYSYVNFYLVMCFIFIFIFILFRRAFATQDCVYSVDCWTKEQPLSCSSDRSVRLWKVAEESHLVFRGHKSSIDCVQYLTDKSFVSAGQDGALLLWKDGQKTPVKTIFAAHGFQGDAGSSDVSDKGKLRNPNWISALATIKMSNIVASGSCDGFVRLWAASAEDRILAPLCAFPVSGFVNALSLSPTHLVVGTGKEHKYGRWWNLKGSQNKIVMIPLRGGTESATESELEEDDEEDDEDSGDGNHSNSESGEDEEDDKSNRS